MTPFGPQLIGATEKMLNALLTQCLRGTRLTEKHWVTLRIAHDAEHPSGTAALAAAVRRRAHFRDAAQLVDEVSAWGLVDDGDLTDRGRSLISDVERAIDELEGPGRIWTDLSDADVAAAERVLNQVLERSRALIEDADSF